MILYIWAISLIERNKYISRAGYMGFCREKARLWKMDEKVTREGKGSEKNK